MSTDALILLPLGSGAEFCPPTPWTGFSDSLLKYGKEKKNNFTGEKPGTCYTSQGIKLS